MGQLAPDRSARRSRPATGDASCVRGDRVATLDLVSRLEPGDRVDVPDGFPATPRVATTGEPRDALCGERPGTRTRGDGGPERMTP
jgi:hypothetical protein